MTSPATKTGHHDLADWCQPILVDFLHELYAGRLGEGHHSVRVLSLSHARMWRFLLLEDAARLPASRKEIIGIARMAGLRVSDVEALDQAVLNELMDVVLARFMRSPDLARAYSRIMLSAAMGLPMLAQAVA